MRYIQKMDAPEFFSTETVDFNADTNWKELHCKPKLRDHLRQEQQELCAYCEGKLENNNSHIEHIEPQEKNPQRRFDYKNLIVSCNGGEACCSDTEKNSYEDIDINSCGHRKSNDFNSNLFLNPVELTDINYYFDYNRHTAAIIPSTIMSKKAQYMIDLLNLDNVYLRNSRHNARIALMRIVKQSTKNPQQTLNSCLRTSRPFISFLQACFQKKT